MCAEETSSYCAHSVLVKLKNPQKKRKQREKSLVLFLLLCYTICCYIIVIFDLSDHSLEKQRILNLRSSRRNWRIETLMGFKSIELEATKEKILETISRDLIDRNQSVWRFARFCDAQEGRCSIALDSQWGGGKTFFVKQTKMLLESFNPFTNTLTDEEKAQIKGAFSNYIGSGDDANDLQPQVCVYYDAWLNDNDIDPVLSLVYEILRNMACDYSFPKERDCVKIAASIIDFFTGKDAKEFIELMRGDDPFSELKIQKDIRANIEDFLDSLLVEKGNRLVIFINELDRCKPSFAVSLLERIKHYFSNDRITFVFSVNVEELQHTIKHYYGDGFDGSRYLDRFFDYRMALPPANMTRYYQEIGLDNGSWVFESVCKAVIQYYSFSLREIEKYYRTAKIAAYKPSHNSSSSSFSDENGLTVGLCLFVPIIIGLRIVDTTLYYDFINGRYSKPLIEIIGNGDFGRGICAMLLEKNETYDKEHLDDKLVVVSLKDKLNQAYYALFADKNDRTWEYISVGECSFNKQTKDKIMRITSLLSEYTSFE